MVGSTRIMPYNLNEQQSYRIVLSRISKSWEIFVIAIYVCREIIRNRDSVSVSVGTNG